MGTSQQVKVYELFMLGLCVYVLAALLIEACVDLNEGTAAILSYADTAVCVIFLVDFFVKLATAPSKIGYLKWGWIDFLSSIPTIEILRVGRLARILRIIRVLRGLRATRAIATQLVQRRAESAFSTAALLAILLIVASSVMMLHIESSPESNITNAEQALWWSFVTITTVGYGDTYPVTSAGRLVAAVLMISGVGLFGTFTGFMATWFIQPGEEAQEDELSLIRERLTRIEALLSASDGRSTDRHTR